MGQQFVSDQSAGGLVFFSVPLKFSLSYHDRYCLMHTKAYFVHKGVVGLLAPKTKEKGEMPRQKNSPIFKSKGSTLNIFLFHSNFSSDLHVLLCFPFLTHSLYFLLFHTLYLQYIQHKQWRILNRFVWLEQQRSLGSLSSTLMGRLSFTGRASRKSFRRSSASSTAALRK